MPLCRKNTDTAISWVRVHIGTPGNKKSDRLALFHSFLGEIAGKAIIAMEEWVRVVSKLRKPVREAPGHEKQVELQRPFSLYMDEDRSRTPEILATQDRKIRLGSLPLLRPPRGTGMIGDLFSRIYTPH